MGRVWPRHGHRGRPLNAIVRRHLIRALRSYVTAMRATSRFGRASRFREKGRIVEALAAARGALEIMARPGVVRTNPAEVAVISCATVLVEELARELKQPGADPRDISDTLASIRAAGGGSDYESWVPYLESRLNQGDASAV